MHLQQQFQQLQGHGMVGGNQAALVSPRLRGPAISFGIPAAGGVMRFEGMADSHGYMSGTAVLPGGASRPFTATRR